MENHTSGFYMTACLIEIVIRLMAANTNVHSYFILFILVHLSEASVAPSVLLHRPLWTRLGLGHKMGCNAYSTGAVNTGAVNLGTAHKNISVKFLNLK